MTFDFGFAMYFLDSPQKTALDTFFIQVQNKLQIYKHHKETTVKLYRAEFKEQMQEHKSDFSIAMNKADADYKKYYDELIGDDFDKHSLALHQAGIQEIEYHYTSKEEYLKLSFKEMADHFNKSELVTLYALLETELRRLCGHLENYFKLRVTLERFETADYLQSILDYLDLIAGLDVTTLLPYISKFKELQFLRNRIMHNGGEFTVGKNEILENIVKANQETLTLESDEAFRILRIKSAFLDPYYDLISNFFFELFDILNNKSEYQLITDRISYLFRFLGKDTMARHIKTVPVKNGRQYVFRIESNDFDNLFDFHCKLTITKSKEDNVIVINQLEDVKNVDRLTTQLPKSIEVVKQVLIGFLPPNTPSQVQIMFY